MKAFKFLSMAAVSIMMVACSSDDNVLQQPTQQRGTMHFTATIAAPSSNATTRTVFTESEGQINVAWKVGNEIAVFYNDTKDVVTVTKVDANTGEATIDGTITSNPEDDAYVALIYPADLFMEMDGVSPIFDFEKLLTQDGTLAYIQDNIDIRFGTGIVAVNGNDVSLKENADMESMIAIWKLTLQDDAATTNALKATALTVKNGDDIVAKATNASGKSEYYLCIHPNQMSDDLTIEATVGSDTYIYTKAGGITITEGVYYQSTVTMAKPLVVKHVGEMTYETVTADYQAQDGDILTGKLSGNYKISIADGAIVTLDGVTIDGEDNSDYKWAGITCEGDATIILKDGSTNTVKGFYYDYPGIYVPSDKTLTIQGETAGTGSLDVRSNGLGSGIGGLYQVNSGSIVIKGGEITATGGNACAGIGGSSQGNCGSITILGGIVTSIGGNNAPGIGSGYRSECGAITISGGTVNATGGYNSVAIGSARGYAGIPAKCASITITAGVTSVTATAGSEAPYSIGASIDSSCGTVTIGEDEGYVSVSPYTFTPSN